ncbi:MAG: right-handed parallel beta-helix repeat-containing protein [Rhizobium sp.]|nr:right-handed parallel beta-helix repeat-containing protein [Rhizobium sp.]
MRKPFLGLALALVCLLTGAACGPVALAASGAIRNVTTGESFDGLQDALSSARDGDAIEVSGGPHMGNFLIERRVMLSGQPQGAERPVLDGGGKGTVLTIRAEGVTVEDLEIRNSGKVDDPFFFWGDAGITLAADGATLSNLHLTGNDWGVVMLGGRGSTIEASQVEDNARDGIAIFGGREHRVIGNTILRNETGVSIDVLHADRRSPFASLGDPASVARIAADNAKAQRSEDLLITRNEVRGNGSYGISATWHSRRIAIEDNVVHATGIERRHDVAQMELMEKTVAASLGLSGVGVIDREAIGSGIYILCSTEDSLIARNRVFDNLGAGIFVNGSDRNEIRANPVTGNQTGIFLVSSNANRIHRNTVTDNKAHGIRIGGGNPLATPSSDNLLTLNDMARNGANAFDSSGRRLTVDDLSGVIDSLPHPEPVKQQLRANRSVREAMLGAMLQSLVPASNRWDDGAHGNHYDDFDETAEGFADANGDGISETGRAIDGGTAVDHHPLDAPTVARLSAAP